jgi:L-ascorbate metabolism protein UlaG (beta-lactamase superfamily)
MSVTGIPAQHGPISFRVGPFKKTLRPGPTERIGYGAIGFIIRIDNKAIVNMGDTLFLGDQWSNISAPDILMIPIGGDLIGNTMGVLDAIEVVRRLRPRIVIPCHYNVPSFFRRNKHLTDDTIFVRETEKAGAECRVLMQGESTSM